MSNERIERTHVTNDSNEQLKRTTHRSLDSTIPRRRGVECWILIYDLDATRTSATSCLRGDQLPRKDADCESVKEETADLEELNFATIGISIANLVAGIANAISFCSRRRRPVERLDPPPRNILQRGKP